RPRPVDARRHRRARDVLGPLEVAHDELLRRRRRGGEREPAVPHDRRRHPVPARAAAELVPEHLRVHVGVAVDEPGGHGVALGIDLLGAPLADAPDGGDPPVPDADVGPVAGQPRAVDDCAVADDDVIGHGASLPPGQRQRGARPLGCRMLRAWRAVPIVVAALGVAAACSSSASRAAAPSTAPATTVGAAPGPSGTASSGTASTSAPPTTATTAAPTTTAAPARVDPFTQPCDLLSADDLHALYPDLPAGQSQVSQQPLGAACAYGTPQHGVAFTLEKPTGDLSSTLAASAPGQGYAKATTAGGDVFV